MGIAARIVLIDREQEAGTGTAAYLGRNGLQVDMLPAADSTLRHVASRPPGLVVLHHRLELDRDLGLLRRIRAVSAVPTIMRAMDADDEVDRVMALELGADDYLSSHASPRELLARIRSVLRRAGGGAVPAGESGWRICPRQRELFGPDGAPRGLTSAEYELLHGLVRQQGVPVQRDALSLAVLRRPYHPEDRALDNLVLRLRRKLNDDGASARLIKSVRGVGYVFVGFDAAEGRERPPRAGSVPEPHVTSAC
ncbi:winged helix-turn-helix domain-containing protein [Falsiroseomonas sp. CW058]|uniref:winged helix-turn-helix domain-containing protein n=1 Tax=Falsiroseomonas sp. CW058 TaxID=3388664 RepID=UPI003D315FEE